MMLHMNLDLKKSAIAGNMKILELLYAIFKYFASRKSGSICRLCSVFLLLFGTYLLTSYVTFRSTESANKFLEVINETVIMEISNESSDDKNGGKFSKIYIPNELVVVPPSIKVGDIALNCGLPESCGAGEFSVHIYTGKDHKDEPRLCIDAKYVLTKDVNNGGRGINVAVVDNLTKSVIRVSHFDTYEKESTALETLLLTLRPGDIVILLTFDEPTRKMSRVARLLLHELGSALIQNLSYRGSWYLVTQKGLTGFSPFEELHLIESNGWPKHHDVRFCVPLHIQGQLIHPDSYPRSNRHRVEFCQKFSNYPLFCDADVVNDPLFPAPVIKRSSSVNSIYSTPVLVMSGENIQYLPLTLETLVRQSGLNPSLVVVFYLPQYVEVPNLCDLFGFMSEELTQSTSYCERVSEAFETANLIFPDAKNMILLGENIVLAPDFLFYMGQLQSLLIMDSSVHSISAFNENGFYGVSGDSTLLYRVETFAGLAVLVRRNFFQKSWCSNDSDSDPLHISAKIKGDSIVPDVSRVLPVAVANMENCNNSLLSSLFARERTVNYDENARLNDVEKMNSDDYEKHLTSLLATALMLDPTSVHNCAQQNVEKFERNEISDLLPLVNNNVTGQVLVIYFHQLQDNDFSSFHLLCQCFGLFHHPLYPPRGLYRGLLRFMWNGNHFLLVGSSSPFYRHKSPHVRPLSINLSGENSRS